MSSRFLFSWEVIIEFGDASRYRRRFIQRIAAGMAIETPTLNLAAIKHQFKSSLPKEKRGRKKLTYITPDRSPIDRIVVPND